MGSWRAGLSLRWGRRLALRLRVKGGVGVGAGKAVGCPALRRFDVAGLLAAAGQGERHEACRRDAQSHGAVHRKRSRAEATAVRTVSGAVPPKLVRLATEASTV